MSDFSTIKQNISYFLENQGISKYKFYQQTGISNGVLSQKGGMSEENIIKILSFYTELNANWLLTGKGEMLKGGQNIQQANNNIASTITQNQNSSSENSEIEALRRENAELKNKLIKLMEEKLGL